MNKYTLEKHNNHNILLTLYGKNDESVLDAIVDRVHEMKDDLPDIGNVSLLIDMKYTCIYPIEVKTYFKPFIEKISKLAFKVVVFRYFKAQKELAYQVDGLAQKCGVNYRGIHTDLGHKN